ncbi:GH25 family lysozyme [Fructobacillus ficulneus]|uniref:Lysozyme n=1 Tax=Fructobacillus ficulneus TaxID=157463 RepID=A0A0K8MF40_9LACO|nr:GH25 family lysozyme [Fructobacillus ficulneus]GAO99097.1 hypothetical protein FFIC_010020 [Fructobacillus ficulneus]
MNVKNTLLTLTAASMFGLVTEVSHQVVAHADSVAAVTAGQAGVPRIDVVDVSSYQGYLTAQDYVTMKNAGVRGIIVKLTEGSTYVNKYAQAQIANAKAAGLQVSAYHYADYTNPSTAQAEANHFADVAQQYGFKSSDLLIDDLEDGVTVSGNVSQNAKAFNDQLQSRGFANTTLYTYISYKNSNSLDTSFVGGDSKVWIAQYPYTPSSDSLWNTGFGMWQWSSNVSFNGISGRFDVSIDYTGMASRQLTAAEALQNAIQIKQESGYLYDGSDQNGGYRWYESGQLYTGFRYYMGTYYWFVNGVRQNAGWRQAWGMTYYTDNNGRAVQGTQVIDGRAYNFGTDGTYYERDLSGYIYDGSSQNGGYRWYANNQLFTGFQYYMGTYYWFVNGVRQNAGWRQAWGYTYYTDQNGRAVQGYQFIDGRGYNFGTNGTYYLR